MMHATVIRWVLGAAAVCCAAVLGPAVAMAAPASHDAHVRAATSACATSGLDVWLNTTGDGTAGTTYYNLEFTNLSGSSCTLYGFPGISGVTLAGAQIGGAASREGTPATATLANGATATATLGIIDVGAFPAAKCGMVTAAGLRVYPPDQTQSRVAPFPFGACSKSGETYLTIGPVQS